MINSLIVGILLVLAPQIARASNTDYLNLGDLLMEHQSPLLLPHTYFADPIRAFAAVAVLLCSALRVSKWSKACTACKWHHQAHSRDVVWPIGLFSYTLGCTHAPAMRCKSLIRVVQPLVTSRTVPHRFLSLFWQTRPRRCSMGRRNSSNIPMEEARSRCYFSFLSLMHSLSIPIVKTLSAPIVESCCLISGSDAPSIYTWGPR